MKIAPRRSAIAAIFVTVGLVFGTSGNAVFAQSPTGTAPVAGAVSTQTGWFNIVWGDGIDGTTRTVYTLTGAGEQTTRLSIDEALAQSMGGVLSFDRKYVSVQGASSSPLADQRAATGTYISVISVSVVPSPGSETMDAAVSPAVTGARPWISIMCKFSDYAAEPENLAFFSGMYANTAPRLDHYWREVSYNTVNLAGSGASGWFELPHEEAYYNPTDTETGTDLDLLKEECIAAADSSVDFSLYTGINMMFNSDFDNGWAWGGSRTMTLDGVTKTWSLTWEPPGGYTDISVIQHEMGHGFGLPHSSGNYGETYDNAWDVMSEDRYNCTNDVTYGCVAQHTISFHKDKLGWIPAGQKITPAPDTSTTITLERLALPATGNYKMAKIPIGGSSTHFYTVEARQLNGYDSKLAGAAVIIHEVDMTRERPAYVIDTDNNRVTSDAGAMFVVGETFFDEVNNISVTVVSATASGFTVTIDLRDVLTVRASDAIATENGPTFGRFTVTRSGATTTALTVAFAVSGTATPGSDYVDIGSSVTIPAGALSATITVVPINDTAVETPLETVIVTLSANADHAVSPVSATVTIEDDDATTLAEALDTALTVSSGGTPSWTGQVATMHDGVDAAQSGIIKDSQQTWMQTTVSGVGVSFWWKVSSEEGYDFLRFLIDGVEQAAISGSVGWQQKTFALTAGSHILKWEYSKDSSGSVFPDRGWVDQLVVEQGKVTVTASDSWAMETGKTGQFTVTRANVTAAPLTVNFAVSGAARPLIDYTSIGTSVTIPAGSASATITVTPINDTTEESVESVIVTLSAAAAYELGAPASATVMIVSNDEPPLVEALDTALSSGGTGEGDVGWWGQTTITHDGVDAAASGAVKDGQISRTSLRIENGAAVSFWWMVSSEAGHDFLQFSIDGVLQEQISGLVAWQQKTFALPTTGVHILEWEYVKDASGSGFADRGWVDQLVATPVVVSVTASDATATENGPTTGQFTVSRTGGTKYVQYVRFTVSGTATPGSDYTGIGTQVMIPGGAASATITVTPIDDAEVETDETVIVSLDPYIKYELGSSASATVTIANDDFVLPTVSIAANMSVATEEVPSNGQFTVRRTAPTTGALTVGFTVSGTATPGSDYDGVGTSVMIPDGSASATITVRPVDDTAAEGDETVIVSLKTDAAYLLGSPASATVTVSDDDVLESIQLSSATSSVSEAGPTATITATRLGGSSGVASVNYATADGTALAGSDYTTASGTLSWANGEAADKTFTVPIANDALDEPDVTFTVTLSGLTGLVTLGSPSSGTVTITDDDPTPTVQFSAAASGGLESTTPALIAVTLSAASGRTVTVKFATADEKALAGSDYTASGGMLTFEPGATTRTIELGILNDAAAEGEEYFTVTLGEPSNATLGATSVHTYTIDDDDRAGSIQLSSAKYTVTEAGETVTITATRTGGSTGAVSASYAMAAGTALAGSDYTTASGTLSWESGDAAEKTFAVTIGNDALDEEDETFTVKLSAPTGSATLGLPNSGTVTITDDDAAPKVQFSQAASGAVESTTPTSLAVTLSAPSGRTVAVNYATADETALAGSDYVGSAGTLTFNPGVTSQTIEVVIANDAAVEENETFAVTLTTPSHAVLGATSTHNYTIDNDDVAPPTVTISAGDETATENPLTPGQYTVTRTGATTASLRVDFAVGGTATAGSDYDGIGTSVTIPAGASSAAITVTPVDDTEEEGIETVMVTLNASAAYLVGDPASATVTIASDEVPLTVQFGLAASSGAESTTPARINVELSAASSRIVTVKYATSNGTAVAGGDFRAKSRILTFQPGVLRRSIRVPIKNNTRPEESETFTISLTAPVNASLGAPSTHTYTIHDEDTFGAIRLSSARYSVEEARPTVTITAQRIGGGSGAVGVTYATADWTATAGSDYTPVSGTLNWAVGDRANKTFTVPIVEDALDEANETFTVTLSAPTGGAILGSPDKGTVIITDNDLPPKVRFSLAASSGVESSNPVQINVGLSAASGRTVTVKYATADGSARAGSDYAAGSGMLTFAPGEMSGRIDVPIIDDSAVEQNQTFVVRLITPVHATLGAPYKHVYTIMDDDVVEADQPDADPHPVDSARSAGVIAANDFDGDGRSDCGVFDATSGIWSLWLSAGGDVTDQLGSAGTVPVTGDFDGDGRCDYGVYDSSSGRWNLRLSTDGDLADQLGSAGSVPVTGDFDGDGRSDYGVYDPDAGLWSLRLSTQGDVTVNFGSAGSVPVTGDFDGDGAIDYGCYTPLTGWWEIALSSGGLRTERLGDSGAIPIVGDFDGDGVTDIGSYFPATPGEDGVRLASPGSWRIIQSTGDWRTETLGDAGAIPIGGTSR